jgi:DNA mismatch repair protein MutS
MSQEQLQFLGGQQTPLMRQYFEIKSQCPDAILFYRLGDFYEMFYDDAIKASKILDIALTARDKSAKDPIPLCGVPHHSAKAYVAKLLDAGLKVAICEQVEDPAVTKGIVKREIVKIITSGTRSDEDGLESSKTSFILSVYPSSQHIALSWLDVSNGSIETANFGNIEHLKNFILTLNPSEIVHSDDKPSNAAFEFLSVDVNFRKFPVSKILPWMYEHAEKEVPKRFNVGHLASMGLEPQSGSAETIAGLISYVEDKNKTKLPHLQMPKQFVSSEYATIDYVTQENLELFESRKNVTGYSNLFSVLNHTMTGMGARELRNRIQKPLQNLGQIQERLSTMDLFVSDAAFRIDVRNSLKTVTDIDRILRRLALRTSSIHDLVSLRSTLKQVPLIRARLQEKDSSKLKSIIDKLDPHEDLYHLLEASIDDAPSFNLAEGGFIRDGYNKELDHVRTLSAQNQTWIANLEAQEKKRTGIPSLKISYNRVFGYYIEVTKVHHDKVPADYIRKQTLVSAERYITPELKSKEEEIQSAKERTVTLEHEILNSIREKIAGHVGSLIVLSQGLAEVDVTSSLSHASSMWGYVRPVLNHDFAVEIKNGRHPVVERNFADGSFVPNDLSINDDARMILLTGPNMAGKSTVMRQVALIVLMAQMGSYVPADSATIGIVDRIFTRIGASDDLAGGRSTFMVEMNETSQILLNATSRSLILLDEIGRGTSTYDGLSIAWAVAEDIDERIKAKTIFATHYHELTQLTQQRPHILTMRMAIREWKDQIVFLRKTEVGVTERSYGIEVAQLAGVRSPVIARAKQILKSLENGNSNSVKAMPEDAPVAGSHPVLQELSSLNINELSPKQALDYLFDIKKRIKGARHLLE